MAKMSRRGPVARTIPPIFERLTLGASGALNAKLVTGDSDLREPTWVLTVWS